MTQTRDAAKIQDALYRIAELAGAAQDLQEFYAAAHAIVGELMYAENFYISLYDEERQLVNWPYYRDVMDIDVPDPNRWDAFGTGDAKGVTAWMLRTGEPQLVTYDRFVELVKQEEFELRGVATEDSTWVGVPLHAEGKTVGALVVQSYSAQHQHTEDDRDLLAFVGQHVGAALSRARAIEETRQRNAELALINSVQSALAGELDLQAIYDVVGDKIEEVFEGQDVDIAIYDEAAGLLRFPYMTERGVRLEVEPIPLIGFRKHVMETGEPLMIAESSPEVAERYGNPWILAGEPIKSALFVPLITGGKATGVISLQNIDREHAYSETDERLLVTLCGSLSVALENARLVHETRQRNAELALINSVQQAIAGELDSQAIYDVVGDKIQEIFDAQVVDIGIFDDAAGLIHFPYAIERGVRYPDDPVPVATSPMTQLLVETKAPVLRNDVPAWERERKEVLPVAQGEPALSILAAPLFSGDKVRGRISLQNVDRTNAFSDSDVRLLTTLTSSLSVALENARLVHETRQRNAELALINSVQDALAGELELQAIYDVVGDKIQEVFDAQVVDIGVLDESDGLIHFPYTLERGQRLQDMPLPVVGFRRKLLDEQEPLHIGEMTDEIAEQLGMQVISGGMPKSALWMPLVVGGKGKGWISLQNLDRAHVFSDSDVQLLGTLAGSLSVALDNARLVHETRQRVAELAVINSVQESIAGELDQQAIYDLVGDKIQEVFDAQVVHIAILDDSDGLIHYPYTIERGQRLQDSEAPVVGFRRTLLEEQEPLLLTEITEEVLDRYGMEVRVGEVPRSGLWMPLVVGGKGRGWISLQNLDREQAFSDSDVQLLGTLAGSLSVALENARLVHETRQRVAELAVINSVQESIAGELDQQAIYDLVGEKLRQVFDAQVVDIGVHDADAALIRFVYQIERGVQFPNVTMPVVGFRKHVMATREPLAIHEDIAHAIVEYGNPEAVVGEESHGSAIFQPLVVGGRATGVISIQNLDREHAFSPSDQQVLATIAGSLSVALENAQLIHETRQRVAELGTVNSVGQALASQLDLDALIELVGERIRETFGADIAYVALHDEATGLIEFPYSVEAGERSNDPPLRYGEGLTSRIIESGEPLLLDTAESDGHQVVGTPAKSYLGVPIWGGDRAIGVISVQSTQEEGVYGEAEMRLLATLAANIGVAIQNARLFAEIARQKQYFESLVGISPVAVIEMDAGERVTGWNPAATALFGYTADEAVGRLIDELVFHDEQREEGREITKEAVAAGGAQRITRRTRKDGTQVDVELMLVPLTVDGERVGFLGIYHDITELQHAREEAEAATQAKSAFLATMSHEIRTPMNAVIGMTGLLLGTDLTPEQREFAEVVRSSGDALLHVIDDILDYSKIEAGKLELEREPFDVRACVEEALDIVAPRAAEKSLELGALVGEGVPAAISGDAARLRQVLLNLLSNAVKFTELGEVVVDLDAEPGQAGSYRLRLTVRDTGIGIPPDRMDHLFESFSQVDASTTRRYGGTGLGLAISKRLVELMGGRLWAESEEGKGSAFHIEFTAAEAEALGRVPFDGTQPHLAGKRLLVVDDNATNREIISRQAQSWGMDAVAAETPSAALALLEAGEHFDVAVLDLVMPEMDGQELAREIRQRLSARELPLLLVTSLGRLPQAREAEDFAAQLAKPLKASQLYDALMRVFVGRDGERQTQREADGAADVSPLRILLAEDSAVNQKVALALLGKLGYRADVVGNGLEALTALEREQYDVVLMDVQMPELDGLDTTRRICERWPAGERPRIVAMTANAMQEDRDACLAAGMDDYVAKPIRPEALAEALRQVRPPASA
jgi:PAS domain S-box-containing protein